MPRNLTTGQYTPPAGTYGVTGSPISSTAYNAFVNDIGNEITFSVDPRGETPMQAPLNMGAQKIVGLATGVASTDAVNVGQLLALQAPGTIVMWAGSSSSVPTGWLLCDGSAVSRATYSNLFAAIGSAFGSGDGSTTFNVPNFKDRCGVGSGNSFTFASTGGAQTVALTTANLAAHNHAVTDPGHNHSHSDPGHTHGITQTPHGHSVSDPGHVHFGGVASGGVGIGGTGTGQTGNTSAAATGIGIVANNANLFNNAAVTGVTNVAAVTGVSTQNAGSGTAHNNMQPYIALNFIIKT